jgi:antitoxin MazE
MKTRIAPIGNSRGIRIPKPLLELTGLSGEVELHAEADALVIRPAKRPRASWASTFQKMAQPVPQSGCCHLKLCPKWTIGSCMLALSLMALSASELASCMDRELGV